MCSLLATAPWPTYAHSRCFFPPSLSRKSLWLFPCIFICRLFRRTMVKASSCPVSTVKCVLLLLLSFTVSAWSILWLPFSLTPLRRPVWEEWANKQIEWIDREYHFNFQIANYYGCCSLRFSESSFCLFLSVCRERGMKANSECIEASSSRPVGANWCSHSVHQSLPDSTFTRFSSIAHSANLHVVWLLFGVTLPLMAPALASATVFGR